MRTWEEINIGQAGANYGWPIREGPEAFRSAVNGGGIPTEPIHFYGREIGNAVTGGYVYRGSSNALQGQYFFADSGSGRMFTLQRVGDDWVASERTSQIAPDAGRVDIPVSFGEDAGGELYVVEMTMRRADVDRAHGRHARAMARIADVKVPRRQRGPHSRVACKKLAQLDRLAAIFRAEKARLLETIPTEHKISGWSATPRYRDRIAKAAWIHRLGRDH